MNGRMEMNGESKNVWRRGAWAKAAGATLALAGILTGCTWDKAELETGICFESEVLPVMVAYCADSGCHNPQQRVEGYDFTSYGGIMSAVSPGRPANSEMIEAMREGGDDRMPPAGNPQPSAEQIATIEAWIKAGAQNTMNCAGISCDTATAVTYSGDIQPMIATYCGGCHGGSSPSAGLDLNNFSVVKANVVSGRIQGSMSGDPNFTSMPPNSALLPSCYVTKIEQWLADGTPDN